MADVRAPRDGAFVDSIGYYDPLTEPSTISINRESALDWISKGAQPSDTVYKLLRKAGIVEDAVLLMSSERCPNQMLRVGERTWGVQFHPEVAADRVRRWNPERLRSMGFDPDALVADAERYAAELDKTWSTVFGRFLSNL